jgi:hypothetical protein
MNHTLSHAKKTVRKDNQLRHDSQCCKFCENLYRKMFYERFKRRVFRMEKLAKTALADRQLNAERS